MTRNRIAMTHPSDREVVAQLYDRKLIIVVLMLMGIGVLMVASSSMVIAEQRYGNAFHYLFRQALFIGLGTGLAILAFRVPVKTWEKLDTVLLFAAFVALIVVLIPGLGRQVNGSTRWLNLGLLTLQASEPVKLFIIVYLASYLQRHQQGVKGSITGFLKPMILVSGLVFLLLLEPDFGAAVVLLFTTMGMLFLAGVRLRYFAILLIVVAVALAVLAYSSPYRLQRLTAFLNPWDNQFGSGYQLTQSLIAFGQGGWFGVGLGDSVQKLFYLPEAHTDFIFAVLAEELGLVGIIAVFALYTFLIYRGMKIGLTASKLGNYFAGFLAFGFILCISIQVMINIGVSCGVLPTKGLTLPLLSSGGSSLLVNCVLLGILLRIDHDSRLEQQG